MSKIFDHAEQLAEALKSAQLALDGIANMKQDQWTDFHELAALCIGIAKVENPKARAALAAWERHNETTKGAKCD